MDTRKNKQMTKEEILRKKLELAGIDLITSVPQFKTGIYNAMDEYAKQQVFEFLKFKEKFQRKERADFHKECVRLGGLFSYVGASNENIYNQFIEQQNKE